MLTEALAVAAIILAPVAILVGVTLWATRRQLPCICEDADECVCGGAWGKREQ